MILNEGLRLFDDNPELDGIPSNSSYGTLQRIQEIRQQSTGFVDFIRKTVRHVGSKMITKLLLLIMMGAPVSMIVVGNTYRNECPKEYKLPLYLTVGGIFGMLKILFLLCLNHHAYSFESLQGESDLDDEVEDLVLSRSLKFTKIILKFFLIVWFCLGNVWLFSIWIPNFSQPLHEPSNWCHPVLFWFTFYQILFTYAFLFQLLILVGFLFYDYYCGLCSEKGAIC
ncbi:hypothetical protein CHS0354_028945 [Potamilus streckersoni]|uniref:Uncharacterized protein n=1 Tax=Potamilus streckersoni TaxID=2493646 RepID=A0AAE0VXI6_9BIVA|nr:hypothetical protein CHS0354_028945 [Potamilus streckersoni]